MKKKLLILVITILSGSYVFAQHANFITSGTIEFEKTINMFASEKQQIGDHPSLDKIHEYETYRQAKPQFKKMNSTLVFNTDKSLFTPQDSPENKLGYGELVMGMQFNTVYMDFSKKATTVQKSIYDSKVLLQDSIRKIKWKLTSETREIAGYTCRRANGVTADSAVYVVAFYTDKIWVSGGPESFTGLPGMILGVVLPHLNVTWYATKVTTVTVPPATILPPKKGKVVNMTDLRKAIRGGHAGMENGMPYRRLVFEL